MPLLSKKVISNYLRSDCQRRFRLDLYPDTQYQLPNGQTAQDERQQTGMPSRSVSRLGLQALAAAGEEWEELKIYDLAETFGLASLVGVWKRNRNNRYTFSDVPLASVIGQARPGQFLVQAQFTIGTAFQQALGITYLETTHNLGYSALRPDLIQVFAPDPTQQRQAVDPAGSTADVLPTDMRLALRPIDIKLTAEPSVPYFIEVTYYCMALAGWLQDQGLTNQFYVLAAPTVWPGSHDASAIIARRNQYRAQGQIPTQAEYFAALEEDLEVGEFGIFASRLRRFFQEELDTVLSAQWQQLPWHVDNRCIGCEYLGYPWPGYTPDPEHCWQMASQQDHLSRVAFISRGARAALEGEQITSVAALANTPSTNAAYDTHHVLRATRTVIAARAQSLGLGQAAVPPQAGTSAVMPAWADLRIYLSADFDIGSGITVAFGFQAVWAVGQQRTLPGQHYRRFGPQVFPVDQRSLQVEERELGNLLNAIEQAMSWARTQANNATIQVYVWDSVTYNHLVRVIGRHLASFIQNQTLKRLAWLFPPDTVVANPDLSDQMSPVTVLRDVIHAVVAAPIPHYYSLLNVAREYHSAHTQAPYNQFQVPALFEDPLSDQIPSERAHEIWSRASGARPWNQQLRQLEQTVRVRLSAIESIAQRLREDLQGLLHRTAPRIEHLRPPTLPNKMSEDARLWFVFAKLNVALTELDIQKIHAMPPHEREARFKSAQLIERLGPSVAHQIIAQFGFQVEAYRHVYRLSPRSLEVKAREGDFTFALSPVTQPGFLAEQLRRVAGQTTLPLQQNQNEWTRMEQVTAVTVRAIDREKGLLILDFSPSWWPIIQRLEQTQILDLSRDVILDPIHRDFFIPRLEETLNAIGNPPIANANAIPDVVRATGASRRPRQGVASPVGDLYWDAGSLYQAPVPRTLSGVRQMLQQHDYDLNPSQWHAWEESLTHRLRLIWGPPGTGKSRTLRTIILGALHEAAQQQHPIRILLTGPTYEAIDNVLLNVHRNRSGDLN